MPGLHGVADVHAIEAVPLAERHVPLTTYDLLVRAAREWPRRTAAVWIPDPADLDTVRETTFAGLLSRVHEVAHALALLGVGPDDAVTLAAPNCSDLLAATLAAEAVGIASPVNTVLEVELLAHVLDLTGSRVVVTAGPELDAALWDRMVGGAADLGIDVLVALSPDDGVQAGERTPLPGTAAAGTPRGRGVRTVRLDDLVGLATADGPVHGLPGRRPGPDDLAAFFHTGGTTGAPKVAAHTHRNQAVTAWTIALASDLDPEAGIVAGLPLFHVNALLVTALAPLVKGGRAIWPSPLGYRDPALYAAFWRLVERFRPGGMSAVPTVYAFLGATPVDADISSLRLPVVGAAPLPDAVRDAWREHTGLELHEGWGLTEATCASSVSLLGDAVPGSVGVRLPYQQVVAGEVDETAPAGGRVRPLPDGRVGELLIAGPSVFAGYVRRVEGRRVVTDEGAVVDGWLRTGDLGTVEAGRVRLHGRLKDLIVRGGHNIDPAVVEDALLSHPAVTGAGAVGRPDRHSGEVPVAFVTLAPDSGPIDTDDLVAWAAEHVAERAARPQQVTVVDSLPLTAIGKPFKPALRERAATEVFAADLRAAGLGDVALMLRHRDGRLVATASGSGADRAAVELAAYDVLVEVAAP
ncbi:MAG: acyl-CoA synthetase [Nocardioides sp.]|nr:acyl-CoA synthetase [Nocardioides sp.]